MKPDIQFSPSKLLRSDRARAIKLLNQMDEVFHSRFFTLCIEALSQVFYYRFIGKAN
ncbi:MAG: hypothetical protein AAF528_05980 [Cyanobacteria bacterium P01_C01_bin.121]